MNESPVEFNEIPKKKKINWIKEIYEIVDSVVLSAAVVLILFTLVFRVFTVNGPSMKPTLKHNDRLVVTSLFYTPRAGDIICFYSDYKSEVLIKRVIATGGQTVDIGEDNCVYVDGKKLDEPYIIGAKTNKFSVEFPLTVQDGTVFVLGDNRNDSMDSRYKEIGLVNKNDILGKLSLRLFPNFGTVK